MNYTLTILYVVLKGAVYGQNSGILVLYFIFVPYQDLYVCLLFIFWINPLHVGPILWFSRLP